MLLQDNEGKVFGFSDDSVTHIGSTGEEAIDNILSGRGSRLIKSEVLDGCE